jgi:hypothetical protein
MPRCDYLFSMMLISIDIGVAENPNKISNLVRGHGQAFEQLYSPALTACSSFVSRSAHAFGVSFIGYHHCRFHILNIQSHSFM